MMTPAACPTCLQPLPEPRGSFCPACGARQASAGPELPVPSAPAAATLHPGLRPTGVLFLARAALSLPGLVTAVQSSFRFPLPWVAETVLIAAIGAALLARVQALRWPALGAAALPLVLSIHLLGSIAGYGGGEAFLTAGVLIPMLLSPLVFLAATALLLVPRPQPTARVALVALGLAPGVLLTLWNQIKLMVG
ncbi:MAG: hypothetical protein QM767_30380 [Anaeromyxobacter sp.]